MRSVSVDVAHTQFETTSFFKVESLKLSKVKLLHDNEECVGRCCTHTVWNFYTMWRSVSMLHTHHIFENYIFFEMKIVYSLRWTSKDNNF